MSRLVVFDLDGTLVDSSRDLADAVDALITEYGGSPLGVDRVTGMVGDGAAVLVRRAMTAAGLSPEAAGTLARFLAHYDERLTAHTRPYDGVPDALARLRADGLILGVLTNKPQRQTEEILDRLGLRAWFAEVVGGDTAAGRKPEPHGLLEMMARTGATVAGCVLVGDSPVDLATARRAGSGICLVRYGFGYRFGPDAFDGSEVFAGSPGEVPDRVRTLLTARMTPGVPTPRA